MQDDGNLVIYGPSGPLWASGTAGAANAELNDQQDGNQVIYANGSPVWATNTSVTAPLTTGTWPGTSGPGAAARYYGYPYSNPPACTDHGACVADKWFFFQGQCTSWVAYWLNQLNGIAFSNSFGGDGRWGNATNWGPHARALGITVNGTPAAGSAVASTSATARSP